MVFKVGLQGFRIRGPYWRTTGSTLDSGLNTWDRALGAHIQNPSQVGSLYVGSLPEGSHTTPLRN